MIAITNDGPDIAQTNYWQSELARRGGYYVSFNSGTARLLLPESMEHVIKDMQGAEYVILSAGPWPQRGIQMGYELLFEDHSQSPFCLHMDAHQGSDRLLPESDHGKDLQITVWTQNGKQLELPGKYRRVNSLPCLEPW